MKRMIVFCIAASTSSFVWGFSQGAPICDVASLPLLPMSSTVASPPPTGWTLTPSSTAYYNNGMLSFQVRNTNATKRARGILIWSKNFALDSVGSFQIGPGSSFDYINPALANCGQASISHTTNTPKNQADLNFNWNPPTLAEPVIVRAFIIEDCPISNCRSYQALTPIVEIDQGFFRDGLE